MEEENGEHKGTQAESRKRAVTPKQSTKQDKVDWLVANAELWEQGPYAHNVHKAMIEGGLYSPNSNAGDVAPTIEALMPLARERLRLARSLQGKRSSVRQAAPLQRPPTEPLSGKKVSR